MRRWTGAQAVGRQGSRPALWGVNATPNLYWQPVYAGTRPCALVQVSKKCRQLHVFSVTQTVSVVTCGMPPCESLCSAVATVPPRSCIPPPHTTCQTYRANRINRAHERQQPQGLHFTTSSAYGHILQTGRSMQAPCHLVHSLSVLALESSSATVPQHFTS